MRDEIIHSKWYKQAPTRLVYLHLSLITDDKGEADVTTRTLARDTSLSVQQVRTALQVLTLTHIITQSATRETTHIILCNKVDYSKEQHTKQHRGQHTKQHKEKAVIVEQSDAVISFESEMSKLYPSVMKMQHPLTEDEYEKLVDKYGRESVDKILDEMENYKDLCKKNKYASKTADKWLSMRAVKGTAQTCQQLQVNNALIANYTNEKGTYGAFLHYIANTYANVWKSLPAPSEEDFLDIMADTSKRGYLTEILKRMDGDPKNLQYGNFYSAFIKVFETILRYESTNTKLNRERAERHDALLRQQEESLRNGAEGQEPIFGNY